MLHAQNSYFVANGKEFSDHIHSSRSCRSILCGNSITSLAVKDLVSRHDLLGKRQYELDFSATLACADMRALRNLRNTILCMRAGEESQYLGFLLRFQGMERGLVEFQSASRWQVRRQRDDANLQLQNSFFGKDLGKNGERIGDAFQKQRLEFDSRDLRLQEGDEHFVELGIVKASDEKPMPREMQLLMEQFGRCKAS